MSTPPKQKASLGIILLTLFISMLGIGIIIPVMPLYAEKFGASEFQIGLLFATYAGCQFLFSPLIGKLSDRVGRRPVLLISTLGTAIGFVLMGAAESLPILFAARVIDGVSGANIGTAQAYIADVTSREERGRAMGLMGATLGLGFIFGPALGGNLSHINPALPFYVVAGIAVINLLLIFFKLPESLSAEQRSHPSSKLPFSALLKHTEAPTFVRVIIANFASVFAFTVMTTAWALFLSNRFGYEERASGNILAYIGVIGVLVQGGLVRRLLKKPDREAPVAVAGAVIMVISLAALPFSTGLWTLLITSTGLAIGNSLLTPTISSLGSLSASADWQGRALGVLQSSSSLGRVIGPLLAGYLLTLDAGADASHYAHTALLTSAGLATLALVILATLRPAKNLPDQPAEPETAR
ncbi:MAG: MFS transporter [Verrucomicrobiales bacterium]|nr:MFS transporter [Verrucomicrobiales bacterium]